MSNIGEAFEKAKQRGRKAFIPFITAGDPDLEHTEKFVYALEKVGSDVIEIGIPFTDPIADGPVIQRASLRAKDASLDNVLELVRKIRTKTTVPIVFLLYANTVYYYGIEAFFKKAGEVGLDGVIIPDVPFEEKEEFDKYARPNNVDMIALVAPTSKERTKKIAENASGFLYCVSSLGVTGTREEIQTDLNAMMTEINKYTTIPTALGFGISNAEQAAKVKDFADGVIIGSAIVKIIEQYKEESEEPLINFAKEIIAKL